jgi:hypothetical protein
MLMFKSEERKNMELDIAEINQDIDVGPTVPRSTKAGGRRMTVPSLKLPLNQI